MSNTNPPVKIGEAWPGQGGIFAGTLRNVKTGEINHIILHPEAIPECTWGTHGKEIKGASCYWDGKANTQDMRASEQCSSILAALDALPAVDDHSDYYIPAQAELNLICCNLRDMVAPDWHWSSTQYSAHLTWLQLFEDGYQYFDTKGYEFAVRAVRRFLAI